MDFAKLNEHFQALITAAGLTDGNIQHRFSQLGSPNGLVASLKDAAGYKKHYDLNELWETIKQSDAACDEIQPILTTIRGLVATARVAIGLYSEEDGATRGFLRDALTAWNLKAEILDEKENRLSAKQVIEFLPKLAAGAGKNDPKGGQLRWCLQHFLPDQKAQFADVGYEVEQPVVFYRPPPAMSDAVAALLKLTVLNNGHGEVFPDPLTMGLFQMDDTFQQSFRDAQAAATVYLERMHPDIDIASVDVCWQLVGQELHFTNEKEKDETNAPLTAGALLKGPSLGLAFAVVLVSSLTEQSLGLDTVISAQVCEDGAVKGVGEIPAKVYHVLGGKGWITDNSNWQITRFIVAEDDADAARTTAGSIVRNADLAIRGVKNLAEAIDDALKVRGLVQKYLTNVKKVSSKLPEFFPSRLREKDTNPFAALRQRVAVVQSVSNWTQTKELSHEPLRSEANVPRERERTIRTWDARFAKEHSRAVILGDPGFGKTWLLKHEAYRLADQALEAMEKGTALKDLTLPLFALLENVATRIQGNNEAFPPTDVNTIPNVLATLVAEGSITETAADADDPSDREIFREWLVEHIGRGKCVLLLDGWDEVGDPKKRGVVTSSLKAFTNAPETDAGNTRYGANRLLLASRIVGYGEDPLEIREKNRMELLAFEPEQRNDFIGAWFKELKPERGGPERGGELKTALENNPAAAELAKIPLMLTYLCMLWGDEPEQGLPTRRVEIYERMFKRLAMRWERRTRHKPGTVDVDALHRDTLDPLCFALLWIRHADFTRKTATGLLGFTTSDSDAHYVLLKANLASLTDIGLLTLAGKDKGDDLFAFTHSSFVEYFAACHLAGLFDTHSTERGKPDWERTNVVYTPKCGFPVTIRAAVLVDRCAWDPWWQEVLVMLAGKLKYDGDVHSYLEALWHAKTGEENAHPNGTFPEQERNNKDEQSNVCDNANRDYPRCPASDDLYRHRLALAALASGETAENEEHNGALRDMEDIESVTCDITTECLRQWTSWYESEPAWCYSCYTSAPHFMNVWSVLARSTPQAEIVIAWLGGLDTPVEAKVEVAQCVGSGIITKCGLTNILLNDLHSSSDPISTSMIIDYLARLGCVDQRVINALLLLLKADTDGYDDFGGCDGGVIVRAEAASAFGTLHCADSDVISALLARLIIEEDDDARANVADVLGQIGSANPIVILVLSGLLQYDEAMIVRLALAEALGKLGCVSNGVLNALYGRLRNKEADHVQAAAAAALVELGCTDSQITRYMLEQLRQSENGAVLCVLAKALKKLSGKRRSASRILLKRLHDEKNASVQGVVAALGKLGCAETWVIDAVVKRLIVNKDYNVRCEAARALDDLDRAEPLIIDALAERLKDDKNHHVRAEAASTLGRLGYTKSSVVRNVVGKLLLAKCEDEDVGVRVAASEAIIALQQWGLIFEINGKEHFRSIDTLARL